MVRSFLSALGAALVVLGVACGGQVAGVGGSGGGGDEGTGGGSSGSCDGYTFPYCADGAIVAGCCPAGAHCAPPASFEDLGGGRCCTHTGSIDDCGGDDEADGGGGGSLRDGSHADAAPTACGSSTCRDGDVCVVTTSGGGACLMPEDGGLCPNGQPSNGRCCDNTTTTYACKPLPSSCGGTLACPCAESLCACGGCALAQAPRTLSCACMYP